MVPLAIACRTGRCGRACETRAGHSNLAGSLRPPRPAPPSIIKGGADDLAADRMELRARLLEGELDRACPLHAVGRDKGRGDARPDDQQAVVAQDHDVAIAEIGEEARAFLRASPRALVVMIGDIADHLQRMLVERQQSVSLHRHGAAGDRVGVEHADQLPAAPCASRWGSQSRRC